MDAAGVVVGKGNDKANFGCCFCRLAGSVLALLSGSNVNRFRIGDRVLVNTALCKDGQGGTGALAEKITVSQEACFPVPDGLPLHSVSNIGRNYCASYHSLKVIGRVGRGDLVLVDGASGGVGMATVALAKAMGCHVIAGVSSESKADFPRQAGADKVLVYGKTKESYKQFKIDAKRAAKELGHSQGATLVVDVVNGELFDALVSCVRPLGTICLVGFTAGQRPIRPGLLLIKEVRVVGSLWGRWARENPVEFSNNMKEILATVQGQKSRSNACIYPLERVVDAFELFEQNKSRGNTVIQFPAASRKSKL